MRILISLSITLFACSSDPVDGADAAATDAAVVDTNTSTDTGGFADDSSTTRDLATQDLSTTEVGQEMGDTDRPDLSSVDAATDAATDTGVDPYAGRPLGQCTEDADCPDGPQGRLCSRTLPGGACLGCADDGDCPTGTSCSMFGVCITDCSTDGDCPPGLECLGSGRCAALDCSAGACPIPLFGCSDSDACQRVDCTDDPIACPDATTCVDGLCVEDRALNP